MEEKTQKTSILEKMVPSLIVVSVFLAFFVGVLWQKVTNLEGGNVSGKVANNSDEVDPYKAGQLSKEESERIVLVSQLDERVEGKNVGVDGEDHLRGESSAKVFILEYSDLECPYCAGFHETAKQAVEEYGGDVAWVYRHFPLDSIHERATPAALASECVSDLAGVNNFWSFVDKIFEDPATNLLDATMRQTAISLGADPQGYDECISSEKFADKVEAHYQSGVEAGVTGTPGNFIMNEKGEIWVIPGAVPLETLKVTIDEALSSLN